MSAPTRILVPASAVLVLAPFVPAASAFGFGLEVPLAEPGWLTLDLEVGEATDVDVGVRFTFDERPAQVGFGHLHTTGDDAGDLGWILVSPGPHDGVRLVANAGPLQIHEETPGGADGADLPFGLFSIERLAPGRHTIALFVAWTPPEAVRDVRFEVSGSVQELGEARAGPGAAFYDDADFDAVLHASDRTADPEPNAMVQGMVPHAFARSTWALLTNLRGPGARGDSVLSIDGPYACPAYVHNLLLRGAPPGDYGFHVRAHASLDKDPFTVEDIGFFAADVDTRPILLVADLPLAPQGKNIHLPAPAPCGAAPSVGLP